jgi:hypothetical protein
LLSTTFVTAKNTIELFVGFVPGKAKKLNPVLRNGIKAAIGRNHTVRCVISRLS